MGCFHPLVREPKVKYQIGVGETICYTHTGEVVYHIRGLQSGEFDRWLSGDYGWLRPASQLIPCGQCVGCKLDYSRQWADRMLLELQSAHCAIFVTLTYAPESVPLSEYKDNLGLSHKNYTLRVKDLQDFNKRLRRRFDGSGDYDSPLRRIRFYAAGEYGTMTLRPHYHAIFFGLSLEDVGAVPALTSLGDPVTNDLGDPYYQSALLEHLWPYGLVSVAGVSWRTCAYVARYVTKKWSSGYGSYRDKDGKKIDLYQLFNVVPEFSIMSRRPGLGSDFLEQWCDSHFGDSILDYSKVSCFDQNGGKSVSIPKYIKRKFRDSSDPVVRAQYQVALDRALGQSQDRAALQLERTDKEYLDLLSAQEQHLISATKILKRDKV